MRTGTGGGSGDPPHPNGGFHPPIDRVQGLSAPRARGHEVHAPHHIPGDPPGNATRAERNGRSRGRSVGSKNRINK